MHGDIGIGPARGKGVPVLFIMPLAALTLFFAWGFHPAEGSGEAHVLDTMVVTARGRDSMASSTPGGIETIGADEILPRHPVGLAHMAAHMPGVAMANDSLWGGDLNIRGLGRNRVIVLIDGCRVNTATDFNAQLGLIDPMEIERMEVLKGPISALYGSGSIGGVIHVITRTPSFSETPRWQGMVSAAGASNPPGWGLYGNAAYTGVNEWVYASGSRRDRSNYRDGAGDRVPNSRFDDYQGKVQLSKRWNEQNQSRIQVQRYEANEVGIPGSGTANLPTHASVTYPVVTRTLLNARHDMDTQTPYLVSSRVNAYFQRVDREVRIDDFPGGPIAEVRPEARHDTLGATWLNRVTAGRHHLVVGLDAWEWSYEGTRTRLFTDGRTIRDTPLPDSRQFSAGVFVEDDWRISDRAALNAGVRVDRIIAESKDLYRSIDPPGPMVRPGERQTETSWNAHMGLAWFVSPAWTATLVTASSYRSPDLMDRFKYIYFGEGNELLGNPELDPERSVFAEAVLHYLGRGFSAGFGAFANMLTDLIVDPSPAGGVRRLENIDEARIYGMEADFRWGIMAHWTVFGNAAYARGRNTAENTDLPFVPPLNGLAGVRWDDNRSRWSAVEVEWHAKQGRAPEGVDPAEAWAVINLAAGYRFAVAGMRHELIARVDNLFDSEYRNYLATSRGFELKEPGLGISIIWKSAF